MIKTIVPKVPHPHPEPAQLMHPFSPKSHLSVTKAIITLRMSFIVTHAI